jgi:hypothetical protein
VEAGRKYKIKIRYAQLHNWQANLEFNFLDVDFANWFSVDQTLQFDPGLTADLYFSQPVQVRDGDSGSFSAPVSEWSMKLGTGQARIQFIMPPGGVTITPSYSPRGNRFTNTTDIVWTGALQESIMQAKLEGALFQFLAGALGVSAPNITLAQATQATDPIPVGQFGGIPYALEGLSELEFPGTRIEIDDASAPEILICDMDVDGDIDRFDVRLVRALRDQPVPPADPAADANGDGVITSEDVRACFQSCTRRRCASR